MTSIWVYVHLHRKHPFMVFFYFSPLSELNNKLSDQPTRLSGPHLAIVPTTSLLISMYIKEDLQQILKTVVEARASTTSKESQNKYLKTHSLEMYCDKSQKKCYYFCQQYKDYFATAKAKNNNQIFFATYYLWD